MASNGRKANISLVINNSRSILWNGRNPYRSVRAQETSDNAEQQMNKQAIRNSEVNALGVSGDEGEKIFSLTSSDMPYRIILEEMDEGAITIKLNGTILYSNQRFANLLGEPLGTVLGSNIRKYISAGAKRKFSRLLKKTVSGRANGVISFAPDNDSPLYLKLSLRQLPNGISGDICIIATDVTRFEESHQQLRKIVRQRNIELEEANEKLRKDLIDIKNTELRLKELIATKDKFFNIVAHDLKNPFTSLIGSSELLSKNVAKMDPEKITALACIFNDAAKNGYAILENLLDWSRSQTGLLKFTPEQINLKKLMDEHILNMNQSINNKEIEILSKIRNDTFIYADQYMIKTVIRNLLSNAVKFSFRKGKVVIDAHENEGKVIISIIDNGRGIPESDIEKIFRIDSKFSMPGTEKELGTGLGLKLCKEFVGNHGGNIWVKSIEEKGSEFKFSIPQSERFMRQS